MRERVLTLPRIVIFLLNSTQGALQVELDRFFEVLGGVGVSTRAVTKAAFSMARRKMHFGAFREINRVVVDAFYTNQVGRRWQGFRLLAVDGSTAVLPRTAEMIEWFGVVDEKQTPLCAIGRVSALYDVLNHITIDAQLAPYRFGERELAAMHLPRIVANDLLLFDRGYPAFWFIALLQLAGAQYCMRTSIEYSPQIQAFVNSGEVDRVIELKPAAAARNECRRKNLSTDPIRVRLVRVDLASGGVEVLITSLVDDQQYPSRIFGELYHQRWGIEEGYKFLKCRVEIENFSGKSIHAVMQEFHAKIALGNLTALNAYQAQEEISPPKGGKRYRINFSHALASMKNTVVRLLSVANPAKILAAYLDVVRRTVEIERPGRSAKRIHRVMPARFRMTYKRSG